MKIFSFILFAIVTTVLASCASPLGGAVKLHLTDVVDFGKFSQLCHQGFRIRTRRNGTTAQLFPADVLKAVAEEIATAIGDLGFDNVKVKEGGL
ncbi:MAG: hypothetical protein ACHQU0_03205 [Candidatus Paceibacteria bacterium]